MFVSFCGSTQLLFPRLEKVSPTRYTEEGNVCMAYTFCGVWRLLVNMREWISSISMVGCHTGESVLALQVKTWKRKSVWRWSIYRKYVSWNRLQKPGTKFKWGRSFKHWSPDFPGQWFPETEYLRASAIFVSGTSGIPPNLNYTSVSPIYQTKKIDGALCVRHFFSWRGYDVALQSR